MISMKSPKINAGFTIIELLVAVAVVGILVAAAVPSLRAFIQNNRATAEANKVHTSLMLARSEALKRGVNVFVTANSGGSSSNEFGVGWTVWWDANSNSAIDTAEIISKVDSLKGGTTVNTSTDVSQFFFRGDGTASAASTIQVRIPECTSNNGRDIALSLVGRLTITRVAC